MIITISTLVMWALTNFVIGKTFNEKVVSVKSKHIKYNKTGIMFIWGAFTYTHFIRMLKQNMGIRIRKCGNCWGYLLILLRISSLICAFFFLLTWLFEMCWLSYEVYDDN